MQSLLFVLALAALSHAVPLPSSESFYPNNFTLGSSAVLQTNEACSTLGQFLCLKDRSGFAQCANQGWALFRCPTGTLCYNGSCTWPQNSTDTVSSTSAPQVSAAGLTDDDSNCLEWEDETSVVSTSSSTFVAPVVPAYPSSTLQIALTATPAISAAVVTTTTPTGVENAVNHVVLPSTLTTSAVVYQTSTSSPVVYQTSTSSPVVHQTTLAAAPVSSAKVSSTVYPTQGAHLFTCEEFNLALTSNGYAAPADSVCQALLTQVESAGKISTRRELAMLIAQLTHESGGFQYVREIACTANGCPGDYFTTGQSTNVQYYGRGYIQLSWLANYKAASEALYGDDRLVTNPDLVASDPNVAMATALWYWATRVHTDSNVQNGMFGSATKDINGAIECSAPGNAAAALRFQLYTKNMGIFCPGEAPNPAGCA